MQRLELFSTPIWTTSIPPSSYNKQEIIDSVTRNYEKYPCRTGGVEFYSNMHNYYEDWNNSEFEKTDLTQLNGIYNTLIDGFIKNLRFKSNEIRYNYGIVNITASRKDQMLERHDHYGADFVAVHYISLDKSQTPTTFENPTTYAYYLESGRNMKNIIYPNCIENSVYCTKYTLNSVEDDFVIFPAFLKHEVFNKSSDKLRITTSCNIIIEEVK